MGRGKLRLEELKWLTLSPFMSKFVLNPGFHWLLPPSLLLPQEQNSNWLLSLSTLTCFHENRGVVMTFQCHRGKLSHILVKFAPSYSRFDLSSKQFYQPNSEWSDLIWAGGQSSPWQNTWKNPGRCLGLSTCLSSFFKWEFTETITFGCRSC